MMAKYTLALFGDYADWGCLRKGSRVLHDGSIVGLVAESNNGMVATFNFSTSRSYAFTLKKAGDYVLAVPQAPQTPLGEVLIWTPSAYANFVRKIYCDEQLLYPLSAATQDDLLTVWLWGIAFVGGPAALATSRLFVEGDTCEVLPFPQQLCIVPRPLDSQAELLYIDSDTGVQVVAQAVVRSAEGINLVLDDQWCLASTKQKPH